MEDLLSEPQSQNEQVLKALLDMTPELVLIVDPACRIAMFNTACENLTGYSRQEALGRNPFDFLIPAAWTRTVQDRYANAFSPEIAHPYVNPWLTKSGEERLIRWRCTALRVSKNERPFILGIGTDITEQTARERATRKNARLLELFFESTLGCAVLLDKDFNFIRVNQAYATACQRDIAEFAGRNHFDLYPSDAKAIFEEVVRTKQTFSVRARPFRFPDNPGRALTYWDWTLVPVLDAGGDVELLMFCLKEGLIN
jgi:PAS domain S-box-containing protein